MSKIYKSRKYDNNSDGYIQYPDKLDELRQIFSKMKSKTGNPLSKITINGYVAKINKLSILMLGHGWNGDMKFLLKTDLIIKKIDDSEMKSKKDYLSPVIKLLQYYGENDKSIKTVNDKMANYKQHEDNNRNDNIATHKEKNNALTLKEINEKLNNYSITQNDNINKTHLLNKLIVSLYFDNELIARNNYWNMKIASISKKNKDFNNNYNYLILDRNRKPIQFVMLNYKTDNKYGIQKFNITNKRLIDLLTEYINTFNKAPGEFLFTDNNGNEYTANSFNKVLLNSMYNVLNKSLNIDLIRKIHITEFMRGNSGLVSENEKRDFARRFLHSPDKQKEYVKIDLFNDE